ncbi:MAG: alpha/beta fold hydrolase, partial [Rhodospirillaceae bacterium]|nr:alpha/beta fold hydrolase [Rhodospirillaceae bacterium]
GVHANYLHLLSDALVRDGIITLRYDKRGVGASATALTSESELRFTDFVADAESWGNWLRRRPGVACIFMLGHSQGGLVATMAAPRDDAAGLILLASSGRTFGTLLHDQLARAPMDAKLKTDALAIVRSLEAGKPVSNINPGLERLFRPSVQPFLISLVDIDPAAELAKLKIPSLIVSGSHDLQVSETDFKRLTAARPDATAISIPGMNHVLKEAPAARKPNLATYANPDLPLAPGLAEAVTKFIHKTACPISG